MIDKLLFFLYCGAKSGGGFSIEKISVELKPILKKNGLFILKSQIAISKKPAVLKATNCDLMEKRA